MSTYRKVIYHAISKRDIKNFNEELNEYGKQGYVPYGNISVSIANVQFDELSIIQTYCILLGKEVEVTENESE